MPDHIHAFIGLRPAMAIADIVGDVKNNSSNFINDHKFVKGKFAWQNGYSTFPIRILTYTKCITISNQEEHHKKKTFKEEYIGFLKKFQVEYNEKYLFEWYD